MHPWITSVSPLSIISGSAMYSKNNRGGWRTQDILFAIFSLLFGSGILTVSILLLIQSLEKHAGEGGPLFDIIYSYPFKNSNWMKSSIPVIVVSSFGIILGIIQILVSFILICMSRRYRLLALVIWTGCHIILFIFNVICFSLAISVKAQEHKDSALFWDHYQFRTITVHNMEGHAYCSFLALNNIFILFTIPIMGATINRYVERPIYLPPTVY